MQRKNYKRNKKIKDKKEGKNQPLSNRSKRNTKTSKKNINLNNNKIKSDKNIDENIEIPNFHLHKRITDGIFHAYGNNSLCAFNSVSNNILYLIYKFEGNSIIFYDLINNKRLTVIKQAHKTDINCLKHYQDLKNKTDLLLTYSSFDYDVKIWNINNISNILTIKYEPKTDNQYLHNCCLLNDNEQLFALVTLTKEPIGLFDLKGNKIKEIKNSCAYDGGISYIDVYFDEQSQKKYILIGGYTYSISYDYSTNKEYKKYLGHCNDGNFYELIINDRNNKNYLIGINDNGKIMIWNFHSGDLIDEIKDNYICKYDSFENYQYGVCLWNEKYLIRGRLSEDPKVKYLSTKRKEGKSGYSIQIIDLDEKKMCKEFFEYKFMVNNIKKINHPIYGESLLVQNGEHIDFWIKE